MGCWMEGLQVLLLQWQSGHEAKLVSAALCSQEELCKAENGGGKRGWPRVTEGEDGFSSMVCSERWSFLL